MILGCSVARVISDSNSATCVLELVLVMSRNVGAVIGIVAILCLGSLGLHAQNMGQSFHDDLGRFVKIVDPSGNVVTYTYDASGNIVAVTPSTQALGSVAIFNLTPSVGSVGTQVTILGQAFDPNPANDVVKFNGTVAVVTSASTSTLKTTVPSGATSGPVTVTVGNSAAQGPQFTVNVTLVSIAITPANTSVPLGNLQQFTATGTYSDGSTQNLTGSVVWASSSLGIATITTAQSSSSPGLAQSVAQGSTSITATLGSVVGTTIMTVSAPVLSSIDIGPTNPTVAVGSTIQLTATGIFTDGSTQNVTTTATWSSSNTAVATVSNAQGTQGLASGVAVGTSTISATSGTISGTAVLTVTQSMQTLVPRFMYASNDSVGISVYTMNAANGQLRVLRSAPPGSSYRAPATISGSFLYEPTANGQGIDGYSVSATNGQMTLIAGSPFPVGATSNFSLGGFTPVVLTPTGTYAYGVVFGGANSGLTPDIVPLSVNPQTGALTQLTPIPFDNGSADITTVAMDPKGRFLYVGDLQNVYVFTLNVDGSVTPVPGSPFTVGAIQVWQVATVPSGNFLYVLDNGGAKVFGFSIDPNSGALTSIAQVSVRAGFTPEFMTIDPSGKYLYLTDYGLGVFGFSIDPMTGNLNEISGSPFPSPLGANNFKAIAVDPSDKFLYAGYYDSNVGGSAVAEYAVNAIDGTLNLASWQLAWAESRGFAFIQGPNPVSYAPAYAYVTNTAESDLSLYSVSATTGAFTPLSTSPLTGFQSPTAVTTDVTGQFAFTVEQNSLRIFGIDPNTGNLTPYNVNPYTLGTNPVAIAVDPLDRFLMVANKGSNNVSAFSFNPATGQATQLGLWPGGTTPVSLAFDDPIGLLLVSNQGSGDVNCYSVTSNFFCSTVATGTAPTAVAFDGTGRHAYVVNQGSNDIWIYDFINNFLTVQNTVSLPNGTSNPQSATVDPTGRFLYVAGGQANNPGTISAYLIDPATGNLSPIAGSPYQVQQSPSSIAVDPSGMFLYVTNAASNNVSAFSITPGSGALAPTIPPTFSTGVQPSSITVAGKVQ